MQASRPNLPTMIARIAARGWPGLTDITARKGGEPIVSLTSYHAHTAAIADKLAIVRSLCTHTDLHRDIAPFFVCSSQWCKELLHCSIVFVCFNQWQCAVICSISC